MTPTHSRQRPTNYIIGTYACQWSTGDTLLLVQGLHEGQIPIMYIQQGTLKMFFLLISFSDNTQSLPFFFVYHG